MVKRVTRKIGIFFGKLFIALFIGLTATAMNGCDSFYFNVSKNIEQAKQKRDFVVLTTDDPLVYNQKSPKGTPANVFPSQGIDYELLTQFAKYYNLNLKFKVLKNEAAVLEGIRLGQGDIGASRLHEVETADYSTGPSYELTHLSLFCKANYTLADAQQDSVVRIKVQKKDLNSELNQKIKFLIPGAILLSTSSDSTSDLFESVAQKEAECAIAEELSGVFWGRQYHEVKWISKISDSFSNSWVVSPNSSYLIPLMHEWFEVASRDQVITNINERNKGYLRYLTPLESFLFLKKIQYDLPEYKKTFVKAARKYGIPWQLVAAVGYQESLWNPQAVSFTGVKGIMQLTLETAEHLGVENRLDPTESIMGGAKYLKQLLNRISKKIPQHERVSLALASYNIGVAHLLDAQRLALSRGKNPNKWKHLKTVLPMLEDQRYEHELQYGMARGNETVQFVDRVQSFYRLLISVDQIQRKFDDIRYVSRR